MNEQFSEEILSAYVDGELTAAERAQVERWLDANPAGREQVDEVRRLSKLLADLPCTEVPQEFPTTVLQLAERRMLLPETTVVATKRRVHRWVIAIASPVAAAAVLLVLLQNYLPDAGLPRPVVVDNRPAPAPNTVAVRTSGGESDPDELSADGPVVAQSDRSISTTRLRLLPAPGHTDKPLADATPFPAELPDAQVAERDQSATKSEKDGEANLQLAELNRAIDEVRDADDSQKLMSVVTVHVIDRAQGLTLLQDIFSDKSEFADGVKVPEKSGDRADLKQGGGAAAPAAGKREALYIEAAPEQLMAAFKAILDREDAALRLTVEAPLELAAFDAGSKKEIMAANRRSAVRSPRPLDGATNPVADDTEELEQAKTPAADASREDKAQDKGKADGAPAAPGVRAKKTGDAPRPDSRSEDVAGNKEKLSTREAGVEEKPAAASRATNGAEAAPARLYFVQVPKQLEERKSRALANARPLPEDVPVKQKPAASKAPVRAGSAARGDGRTVTEGKKTKRAPALVRVLLVIEPEPAPAAPPVPAAGKGPGGAS